MTTDQEHLVTILILKHGGFESLVDAWLYDDGEFTEEEFTAVDAWLASEQKNTPMNATSETTDEGVRFVTIDFPLDLPE